jgi:methyltransferase (TIGR00027 family)
MAAVRARETERPDRLFDDRLAAALAGPEGFELMTRMEVGLPANPTIPIRTRFFDDALVRLLADGEIKQVVALAAGMDARAYRLDLPVLFEIDSAALVELKEARLAAASAEPRCKRITIGADLTKEWAADLLAAGYDSGLPSVFLAEGLLGYLEEPEVHRFLDVLDRLAAAGSFMLTDVSGRSALEASYMSFWTQRLAENGIPGARFGTDDPEGLLAAHGWNAHVLQYGDEGADFGRWPYPSIPRDDRSLPHNYLIIAER